MRQRSAVVAWVVSGIVVGALGGAFTTWLLARKWTAAWDRSSGYADQLRHMATSAQALALLDGDREADARALLERELVASLQLADGLRAEGATLLLPLAAGEYLAGLHAAEAYANSHPLDTDAAERARRLRAALCLQISPNSKYRGLCEPAN